MIRVAGAVGRTWSPDALAAARRWWAEGAGAAGGESYGPGLPDVANLRAGNVSAFVSGVESAPVDVAGFVGKVAVRARVALQGHTDWRQYLADGLRRHLRQRRARNCETVSNRQRAQVGNRRRLHRRQRVNSTHRHNRHNQTANNRAANVPPARPALSRCAPIRPHFALDPPELARLTLPTFNPNRCHGCSIPTHPGAVYPLARSTTPTNAVNCTHAHGPTTPMTRKLLSGHARGNGLTRPLREGRSGRRLYLVDGRRYHISAHVREVTL